MAQFDSLNDQELIPYLNNGNRKAFEEIYHRYWYHLYNYAYRLLQDPDAAQDIVQDIFIIVWVRKEVIEINRSLASYLYTSLKNKVLKSFEHEKVQDKYIQSFQSFLNQQHVSPEAIVIEKELAVLVNNAINELPERMREVFILSREAQLPHKNIAEKLNISQNTVKKQINLAIKIIKDKISLLTSVISLILLK